VTSPPVVIKCRKCGEDLQPDLSLRVDWVCPKCQYKNPNFRRHYRSVADLYILWLFFTFLAFVIHLRTGGFDLRSVLALPILALLISTIVVVYKSTTPWKDNRVKVLIWVVFSYALALQVAQVAQMSLAGKLNKLNISFLAGVGIVYTAIFGYLFWLQFQSKRYSG
jgi:hypothetical protein